MFYFSMLINVSQSLIDMKKDNNDFASDTP